MACALWLCCCAAVWLQDIKFRADLKHKKGQIKKLKAAVAREEKKATAAAQSAADAEASLPGLMAAVEAAEADKAAQEAKVDEILESVKVRLATGVAALLLRAWQASPRRRSPTC